MHTHIIAGRTAPGTQIMGQELDERTRWLASRLGMEEAGTIRKSGATQSLAPGSRQGARSRAAPNDFGGLLDSAKKTKRRQSTALDAERQRQDEIFKKKLAERRKNRM